jgi:hypothetical protein
MWWAIVPFQVICCFLIQPLWDVTATQLKHYFPSIKKKSIGRQAYIVKNMAKAVILMFLAPPALWVINRIVLYNTWDLALIKCLGAMYAAGDVIAVVKMFDKLPLTTQIHHSCVVMFSIMNATVLDYTSTTTIWRNLALLAAASAPTYGVNAYLAIRCIDEISLSEKKRLANFALSIYSFFLTFSIVYQSFAIVSFTVTSPITWDVYIYIMAVLLIFYDDWSLSRYLYEHSSCQKIK